MVRSARSRASARWACRLREAVTTSARKRVPKESRAAVLRRSSMKPDVFVAMDQTTRHSGSKLSSQTGPVGRLLY